MTFSHQPSVWLFPGQGSQKLGMGKALSQMYPEAASVFDRANDVLGYDLSEICWGEDADRLNQTLHTQPALLTHSVALLRVLQAHIPDFHPRYVAGHSLGEISALVAADALTFEDALRLVKIRAESMQYAGEIHAGGMSAVLGLPLEEVEAICTQVSASEEGQVWVANDNCPGQVVISGDDDALEASAPLLKEAGARRVLRLAVSIAAHSPLMGPAQDRFNGAIDDTDFKDPTIDIVGNVHAAPLSTSEDISEDLRAQLNSRVRWTETIQYLHGAGISAYYEIGSGSVLTGLLRRILPDAEGFALDDPEILQSLFR